MHHVADHVRSIGRSELHLQLPSAGHYKVSRLVLVSVRVAANDDGLLPAGHQAGNVLADDSLAEDGAAEDVTDRAVGGLPHGLELKLLYALLVRRDSGALDSHVVLLNSLSAVHGDLVVRLVTVLHSQVVSEESGEGGG